MDLRTPIEYPDFGGLAVVTGGAGTIGAAVGLAFARSSVETVLVGRTAGTLEAQAREIFRQTGSTSRWVVADVTDPRGRDDLNSWITDHGSVPTAWINAAGSFTVEDRRDALDLDPDNWTRTFSAHLDATFFCCQLAARHMRDRGGAIVNLSSRMAGLANPRGVHYAAAKAAVESVTATLAVEWAPLRIRVNAVAPGLVRGVHGDVHADPVPPSADGLPADVAAACAFLAAPTARWISGEVLHIDGGMRVGDGLLNHLARLAPLA